MGNVDYFNNCGNFWKNMKRKRSFVLWGGDRGRKTIILFSNSNATGKLLAVFR